LDGSIRASAQAIFTVTDATGTVALHGVTDLASVRSLDRQWAAVPGQDAWNQFNCLSVAAIENSMRYP
jgi:hypothetical protein